MLTLQDVIDYSDLTEEEVAAVAEHEHIPDIVAAEFGNYLVHSPDGVPMLKRIIIEDIETARRHGHRGHVRELHLVLQHFIRTHPDLNEQRRT